MKSDNEEVVASLCLKYSLRLGDDQRALSTKNYFFSLNPQY